MANNTSQSINFLTVREVAEMTGRHPETVRRWIRSDMLDAHTVPGGGRAGHEYRVRESDLIEFLQSEGT